LFITLANTLLALELLNMIGAKASLRLKFTSQKQLSTLLEALKPETKALVTRRATVKLDEEGLFLVLTVEAKDTIALRATLNAYLRWINSLISVIQVVEDT
jgi:tRNA threonylcarbamoyladenosine modification (KEOPS) complex  Pcc1 subunit